MANSSRGTNPLLPIAVVGAVVAAIVVGVFAVSNEAPPDQPTIISEDVNAEPAGAGTAPEGEADETEEGITDVVDEVEPAAEGVDSVPAADEVSGSGGADGNVEGETDADEGVTGTQNSPVVNQAGSEGQGSQSGDATTPDTTSTDAVGAGGADGEQEDGAAAGGDGESDAASTSATEEFLIDQNSPNDQADNVDTPGEQNSTESEVLPEGRDAQTDLDPSECQDIVRDTDGGGADFIPTPSGPNGNTTGDCVESAQ